MDRHAIPLTPPQDWCQQTINARWPFVAALWFVAGFALVVLVGA